MVRNKYPWRWVDGYQIPHPGLLGFVKAIMANPGDETARLVMADFVAELDVKGIESSAATLREPGYWYIGGALNRKSSGLGWMPERYDAPRYVYALMRRDMIPKCGLCGGRAQYTNYTMMRVSDTPNKYGDHDWLDINCHRAIELLGVR